MKYWINPQILNGIAISISPWRWRLLIWSALTFVLFVLLTLIIDSTTPAFLVWIAMFILFAALQILVIASFIFFFQVLPSSKVDDKRLLNFYKAIEWCESIIFCVILPLPTLLYIYALIVI